jgi:hypothetical protein
MKDYQAALEKLCQDAADAAAIRDQATSQIKRDMFTNTSCGLLTKLSKP